MQCIPVHRHHPDPQSFRSGAHSYQSSQHAVCRLGSQWLEVRPCHVEDRVDIMNVLGMLPCILSHGIHADDEKDALLEIQKPSRQTPICWKLPGQSIAMKKQLSQRSESALGPPRGWKFSRKAIVVQMKFLRTSHNVRICHAKVAPHRKQTSRHLPASSRSLRFAPIDLVEYHSTGSCQIEVTSILERRLLSPKKLAGSN